MPTGGPAGCDVCFEELDHYVELAHLDGCPACREEHDSLLALVRSEPR